MFVGPWLVWSNVEYTAKKFRNQKIKMKNKNVDVLNHKVTPNNVVKLFRWNNVPNDFYLTLDIDSYDYFVLEKILENYQPSFIISEINEKIPADIKFSLKYDESFWWDASHFYGYSISMIENLLHKFDYKILELDYNNIVLVKGKQIQSINEIYYDGYLNKKDRKELYPWNNDFEPIYSMDRLQQLEFIKNKFSKFEGMYILE